MICLRTLALASLLASSASSALSQTREQDVVAYAVQAICLDSSGGPSSALPIGDNCSQSRPQRSNDPATYRKHDWPNDLLTRETALGYQASDSVLQHGTSRTLIVQTMDFGTDGRTFGQFDAGRGDGGQVLVAVDGWASFAMTEDGTGGVQWFIGEGCKRQGPADQRFASWLVFRPQPRTGKWTSALARLKITANPDVCPQAFNDAFTRYRFDRVSFPFRIFNGAVLSSTHHQLEVVISEHYGGSRIRTADHLERFFMAKGLGLVRWERWANDNLKQPADSRKSAEALARTARCPRIDGYAAPDRNWLLVDCRTWTTLVPQRSSWSVDDYKWPALKRFD